MGVDKGGDKGAGTMIEEGIILSSGGFFTVFADFPDFSGFNQNIAVADDAPRITYHPPGTVNTIAVC